MATYSPKASEIERSWHLGCWATTTSARSAGATRRTGTSRWCAPCGFAVWWLEGEAAVFEIEARAFCHQMVRSLVALLVSVGLGRHKPSDVGAVIAARDRSASAWCCGPPSFRRRATRRTGTSRWCGRAPAILGGVRRAAVAPAGRRVVALFSLGGGRGVRDRGVHGAHMGEGVLPPGIHGAVAGGFASGVGRPGPAHHLEALRCGGRNRGPRTALKSALRPHRRPRTKPTGATVAPQSQSL